VYDLLRDLDLLLTLRDSSGDLDLLLLYCLVAGERDLPLPKGARVLPPAAALPK
jgi:hypothetical protein